MKGDKPVLPRSGSPTKRGDLLRPEPDQDGVPARKGEQNTSFGQFTVLRAPRTMIGIGSLAVGGAVINLSGLGILVCEIVSRWKEGRIEDGASLSEIAGIMLLAAGTMAWSYAKIGYQLRRARQLAIPAEQDSAVLDDRLPASSQNDSSDHNL